MQFNNDIVVMNIDCLLLQDRQTGIAQFMVQRVVINLRRGTGPSPFLIRNEPQRLALRGRARRVMDEPDMWWELVG